MAAWERGVVELASGREHEVGVLTDGDPQGGRWVLDGVGDHVGHHLGGGATASPSHLGVGPRPLLPELRIGVGPAVRFRRLHAGGG